MSLPEQHHSTLSREEMDALVRGEYDDVFRVFGLHRLSPKGLVVRLFLPWATSVELIHAETDRKIIRLSRIHEGGLFEAVMVNRRKPFAYYYRVDSRIKLDDAYRFGSLLQANDLYLFNEGTHEYAYRWLGAHYHEVDGVKGVNFAVWAPNARRVSVVGDFNDWDGRRHIMRKHPVAGVWDIFIPDITAFAHYKFNIVDASGRQLPLKADPYARSMQHPPQTASRVVLNDKYEWRDQHWMAQRHDSNPLHQPVSIYEVHAGSWCRKSDQGNRYLSYRELADELIPYVCDLGFSHIQLMPISEYPFDGSWGYQPVGMFAPTIRFGTPDEFKYFVEQCHLKGIGVLIDWVPGHFPSDPHGLGRFDGTCLYEHEDIRRGFHPDWNTLIYNYGRSEVVSYLLSNANYWLEEFHLDGLRVDAVASMLYLDYSRKPGEWLPNQQGGRENLEAVNMLRTVNARVYRNHPGIMMVAEESTAWPGVSRPVDQQGLGFGFKWNMGWMNDSLRYMSREPVHRKYHHNELTFGIFYAWNEHFILPLSHDEVVHGKGSLVNKMPGDDWQKFANLRAYLGFMWCHPGKKLLFMGAEFGQRREWNHDSSLDWHLLGETCHRGVQSLVRDLNLLYRGQPALFELDCHPDGFQWLQLDNEANSIFAWVRMSASAEAMVLVVCNFTPQTHEGYRVGVPRSGWYRECVNTDATDYGGSGKGNAGGCPSEPVPWDGYNDSLVITLPPLATLVFEYQVVQ